MNYGIILSNGSHSCRILYLLGYFEFDGEVSKTCLKELTDQLELVLTPHADSERILIKKGPTLRDEIQDDISFNPLLSETNRLSASSTRDAVAAILDMITSSEDAQERVCEILELEEIPTSDQLDTLLAQRSQEVAEAIKEPNLNAEVGKMFYLSELGDACEFRGYSRIFQQEHHEGHSFTAPSLDRFVSADEVRALSAELLDQMEAFPMPYSFSSPEVQWFARLRLAQGDERKLEGVGSNEREAMQNTAIKVAKYRLLKQRKQG